MSESKEIDFVSALLAGDESAFKELVLQYQDDIYSLCLNYLKNEQEAEDIAQDVFIEVFHSIHSFNQQASISTWIYRIAVNKSLERLRYNKRLKRFAWITSLFGNEERFEGQIRDWVQPNVEDENKERAKVLYGAIDNLPEKQRTAFILHKLEGKSYKEIMDILSVSLASVESLMHRAKKNLQKDLKTYYQNL